MTELETVETFDQLKEQDKNLPELAETIGMGILENLFTFQDRHRFREFLNDWDVNRTGPPVWALKFELRPVSEAGVNVNEL